VLQRIFAELSPAFNQFREDNPDAAAAIGRSLQHASTLFGVAAAIRPAADEKGKAVYLEVAKAEPPPEPPTLNPTTLKVAGGEAVAVTVIGSAEEAEAAAKAQPPTAFKPTPAKVSGPKVVAYEGLDEAEVERSTLAMLPKKLAAKAEATRWQRTRQPMLGDPDQKEALRAGDERHCGPDHWMTSPSYNAALAEDPEAAQRLADCFDATAAAVKLWLLLLDVAKDPDAPSTIRDDTADAMSLLADAQSALRSAAGEHNRATDPSQDWLYQYLRREAKEERRGIYLPSLSTPTDASIAPELKKRADARRAELEQWRLAARARRRALQKIEFKSEQLAAEPTEELARDLLSAVAAAVREHGVPPSDVQVRQALRPHIVADRLPEPDDSWAPNQADRAAIDRVLSSIEHVLAQADAATQPVAKAPDPVILEARGLLAGKVMVLLGGEVREQSRQRLERDLGLNELRWETVAHHQSFDAIAPKLAGGDVDVVVVMTLWMAHRDGPSAKQICRDHGIPFVQLPSGYGSNRVAHEILHQASTALAGG
jgi:hypothetical protein